MSAPKQNTFILRFRSEGPMPNVLAKAAKLTKQLTDCSSSINEKRIGVEVREHHQSGLVTQIYLRADLQLEEMGKLLSKKWERPSESAYLISHDGLPSYGITKMILEQYGGVPISA